MDNKLVLGSLASDLKRVSMSLHRGSLATASKFATEALNRRRELDTSSLDPYIQKLLDNLESTVKDPEDALMYSTLFQNYSSASS